MSFAGIVLIDGNKHRRAGTGDVGGTHRVTGSLRGDHDDIQVLARNDLRVVDVKAVSKRQGRTLFDVRFDLLVVNVGNEKARRITKALYFSAYAIGLVSFLEHVSISANYGLELNYFITVASCGIKAFCIVLIVKRVFWDGENDTCEDLPDTTESDENDGLSTAFKIIFSNNFYLPPHLQF